jgi:hypothetical protein
MPMTVEQLLAMARNVAVSEEELEAQRRSFAWGNTHIENERITRAMIDKAADRIPAR